MRLGDRYSEYEKPAAYAPLLVQHTLALGACSQEAEGRAGKASSSDSAIREQTSCTRNQPLPSLLLSYGRQCHLRAALHKHLPFAQKLPAHAPLLVQRALVFGACSQEVEGRAWKASSLDSAIRRVDVMHAQPAVATPAPFVWKPVSQTNSAVQASAICAEVASIRPPSSAKRISIGGLQARSGRTGRESELS